MLHSIGLRKLSDASSRFWLVPVVFRSYSVPLRIFLIDHLEAKWNKSIADLLPRTSLVHSVRGLILISVQDVSSYARAE
jgi:hypothetical protein